MKHIRVKCSYCSKNYQKEIKRFNEAEKFEWKHYCSRTCQNLAKLRQKELLCGNPLCRKTIIKRDYEIKQSRRCFCSKSCAAKFNNIKFPKRQAKINYCLTCGLVISPERKFCSNNCIPEKAIIEEKQIIAEIQKFYKVNGRLPFKEEYFHRKASRLRFGSWNKAVKAAGLIPNPAKFAKKHIANDGHKCDSLSEKIIDDWLSSRKIVHQRNVPYPFNKKFTADFKIKDYFIEFFGLHGQMKNYDAYMQKKLDSIKKNHLKLISIFPRDLFPKSRLECVLKV